MAISRQMNHLMVTLAIGSLLPYRKMPPLLERLFARGNHQHLLPAPPWQPEGAMVTHMDTQVHWQFQ